MKKIMDKPVNPIFVMIFMFIFSLVGLIAYLSKQKKETEKQVQFLNSTLQMSLKEGVNIDSLKSAIVKSDTLK